MKPITCRRIRSMGVVFLLALCYPLGCSSTPQIPVAGTVTINGQPATAGVVLFYSDAEKGNKSAAEATAHVADDGTFKLTTVATIPAGWYRVIYVARTPITPVANDATRKSDGPSPEIKPAEPPKAPTPMLNAVVEIVAGKTEYAIVFAK